MRAPRPLVPCACVGPGAFPSAPLPPTSVTLSGKGKKGNEKLNELLMHEIAHQWVGDLIGFPFWVKEGICCYLEERMGDLVNGRKPRPSAAAKSTSTQAKVAQDCKDDAKKVWTAAVTCHAISR